MITNADWSECDKEPIHIPGAIQPHGVLLVLSDDGRFVTQSSENAAQEFGPKWTEGASLDQMFCSWGIQASLLQEIDQHARLIPLKKATAPFDRCYGLLHRSPDGQLVLELERVDMSEGAIHSDKWLRLRNVLEPIRRNEQMDVLLRETCDAIRELTGYDRVMIYRFHEDLHGEVVAEKKLDQQESWLGLHYPASDIPAQARELYTKNWIRMIPDIDYRPVKILPAISPLTDRPLDMTYCHLRSVSPVHIQYLRNMGTRASLSFSLVTPEGLWGLIACHNSVPRYIHYFARLSCQTIAKHLSASIVRKQMEERTLVEEKLVQFCQAFRNGRLNLQLLNEVIPHETVATSGKFPLQEAVEINTKLADLLHGHRDPLFSATDLKGQGHPGLLAIRLRHDCWLAISRQESIREVRWAGDPNQPVVGVAETLHPRASFKEWDASVRGHSKDWTKQDLEFASLMQHVLSGQRSIEWLRDHLAQRRSIDEQFALELRASADKPMPDSKAS